MKAPRYEPTYWNLEYWNDRASSYNCFCHNNNSPTARENQTSYDAVSFVKEEEMQLNQEIKEDLSDFNQTALI